MRGRVRLATTVSTSRWETRLPGSQGQLPQLLPRAEVAAVAASDSQNAPTGRTRVSSTGARASSPHSRLGPPASVPAMPAAIATRPPAATTACGVQAA